VDAPEGAPTREKPSRVRTSTSTVAFPRESRTLRTCTDWIFPPIALTLGCASARAE
jgi:hypothetical protein